MTTSSNAPHPGSADHFDSDADEAERWSRWLSARAGEAPLASAVQEPDDDGCLRLLDVVAAVDYLARGHRSGLTVWGAIEEALRWWLDEHELRTAGAPDPDAERTHAGPLGHTLERLAAVIGGETTPDVDVVLDQALRRWASAMAERFNGGHYWPHPVGRRAFPPPRLRLDK